MRRRTRSSLLLLAMALWAAPAVADIYTRLDGVLAAVRLTQQAQPGPLLVGLPGQAVAEDFTRLLQEVDKAWLQTMVASDDAALQRGLLHSGVPCGVLVQRYGRRGYEARPQCVSPQPVTMVLLDGQELRGEASPGAPGTLLLSLERGTPLVVPLEVIEVLR